MIDREQIEPFELLGETLKNRRKALGLNQTELSGLANCSSRFIVEAESGKRTVRLETLLRLMQTLGLQFSIGIGNEGITVSHELGR